MSTDWPAIDNDRAPQSRFGMVIRVTSGNFLEMFDFVPMGIHATYIAKALFPAKSDHASLMLTFATFGAGFLIRPFGAIVLGSYIDRIGRRRGRSPRASRRRSVASRRRFRRG